MRVTVYVNKSNKLDAGSFAGDPVTLYICMSKDPCYVYILMLVKVHAEDGGARPDNG